MKKMDDEDLLPDIANLDMIEEGLYLGVWLLIFFL